MSYNRIERLVFPDENLVSIVAAMPSNSRVILAPGNHNIGANTVLISATGFSIEGQPGATIVYTGSTYAVRLSGACADVTLRNFRVSCSNALATAIYASPGAGVTTERIRVIGVTMVGTAGTAVVLSGSATGLIRDVIVRDCEVNGAYNGGIQLIYQFDGVSILNNTFRSSVTAGFGVSVSWGGTSGNLQIAGNRFLAGFLIGINLGSNALSTVISDNVIVGNASMTIGISFSGQNIIVKGNMISGVGAYPNGAGIAGSGLYNVIEGNEIRSPGIQGISYGGSQSVIAANHIYDSGGDGIILSSSPGVEGQNVVQGNEIYSPDGIGINVYGQIRVNVCGGVIDGAGSHGIQVGNGGTYALVTGVVTRNCSGYGVFLATNCARCTVEGCRIAGCTSGGIGVGSGCHYTQLVGNHVTGAGLYGIEVNSSDYCQINANVVQGSSDDGIRLSVCNYGQCNDNEAVGNGSDGIALLNSDEYVVDANRCYGNAAYGILEDANCDQNLYGANHLRGNTTGASSYSGTNRTEAGNKT